MTCAFARHDQAGLGDTTGHAGRRARGRAPPVRPRRRCAITEVAPGVRMPLGSRWVANFSPLTTMVWPALCPPQVRTTKSMVSVVASRSVALPLPSSPHWAPRTTIAGIASPPHLTRTAPGHKAPGLLRQHATKSADPAWGAWVSVRAVDPLLVITNRRRRDCRRRRRSRRALEVLRSARVGRGGRSRRTPASSTACCTAPAPAGSWWPAATAACTPSWRRCTGATSCAGRVLGLLPLGTGNDFARGIGIPLDVEEAARLVLDGRGPPGRPDRRRARRRRRQQRARRGGRRRGRHGRRLEDAARRRSGSAG